MKALQKNLTKRWSGGGREGGVGEEDMPHPCSEISPVDFVLS